MKTIQTILPVYDSLSKQDYRRTRNTLPVHCPRWRLPAFQWNVETDDPGEITTIEAIGKDGTVQSFPIFHGWRNGAAPFDTFDTDGLDITSAIKLAAGVADGWVTHRTSGVTYSIGSVEAGDILTLTGDFVRTDGIVNPYIRFYIHGAADGANITLTTGAINSSHTFATGGILYIVLHTASTVSFSFTNVSFKIDNICSYFNKTNAYIQDGGGSGWTNNSYDAGFVSVEEDITHAQVTAAGGTVSCWNTIVLNSVPAGITTGEELKIVAVLTMEGGTTDCPKIALQNTGTLAIISNIITLAAGTNILFLKATATLATGWAIVVYNTVGETAHFNIVFTYGEKVNDFPRLYTVLTNDYFQYKGGTLGLPLPYGNYYLKFTTANNFIYYSEIFAVTDIYPNLVTDLDGVSTDYDTFNLTTGGTEITSAIELVGDGQSLSNTFSVIKNESINVIFFLTLNSGELPTIRLREAGVANRSNTETAEVGLNEITLIATDTGDYSLMFRNTIPTNFSTSEVLVMREYSATHIKLTFDNSKDLGDILYQDGFSQTLWLPSQLVPPQSEQIDIGEEKNGIFISEKIVNKFKFKIFTSMGRELYRAVVRIPLHDDIDIIDEVGNTYSPAVGNIWINPLNWPGFDYVQVEILFNDNNEIYYVSNNANFT